MLLTCISESSDFLVDMSMNIRIKIPDTNLNVHLTSSSNLCEKVVSPILKLRPKHRTGFCDLKGNPVKSIP